MTNVRLLALTGAVATMLLPAAFLLPGCSGGSGGGLNLNPTPSPTQSPTQLVSDAPLTLSANQTASLSLSQTGNALSGTLTVNAPAAPAQRTGAAFTVTIPAGVYTVTGTFTPPRSFTLSGNFPAPIGAFTLTGTIPTQSQTGSYTLTANGQTVSGTLPVINPNPTATSPTPTSTSPTPTSTTPSNNQVQGTLTFTNVSADYNGGSTAALTGGLGGFSHQTSAAGHALGIAVNFTTGARVRSMSVTLTKTTAFTAGETFTLNQVGPAGFQVGTYLDADFTGRGYLYSATGGQVKVVAISSTSLTLQFINATYGPSIGSPLASKGTFRLNGTLTIPAS